MPTTEPMERTEAVRLMDELKREAAERARRRLARGAGSAVSVLAVAGLLVWSLGALTELGERSYTAPGEAAGYVLTDLHLAGPGEGPDRGPSAGEVRIGFSVGWSGDVFPGTHA